MVITLSDGVKRGSAELAVLAVLADQRLHGYENVLSIGCAHMPPNIDLLEPADTANQVSAMSALGCRLGRLQSVDPSRAMIPAPVELVNKTRIDRRCPQQQTPLSGTRVHALPQPPPATAPRAPGTFLFRVDTRCSAR